VPWDMGGGVKIRGTNCSLYFPWRPMRLLGNQIEKTTWRGKEMEEPRLRSAKTVLSCTVMTDGPSSREIHSIGQEESYSCGPLGFPKFVRHSGRTLEESGGGGRARTLGHWVRKGLGGKRSAGTPRRQKKNAQGPKRADGESDVEQQVGGGRSVKGLNGHGFRGGGEA